VFALLGLLAILAVGCTTIARPEGWAAPVADRGLVFAQLDRGELSAVRFLDGRASVEWTFPTDDQTAPNYDARYSDLDFEAIYATPILEQGVLYLAAYDGFVLALDPATGRPLDSWREPADVGNHIVATPVLDGDRLLVATDAGRVVAIDAATGAIGREVLDGGGRLWSGPAGGAGNLYVADFERDRVTAVDSATSDLRWSFSTDGGVIADLVVDRDQLIVGSIGRSLFAIDAARGTELWRFEGDGWFTGSPLVAGDTIYAGTLGGSVYAIDGSRGSERWRFTREGAEFRAQPILAGGALVVGTRDGELIGLSPSTGDLRWEQDPDTGRFLADPLMIEADVLFLTHRGDLVRVTPSDGAFQRFAIDE
jgi:outer membrane protein assembly factor BamB